MTRSGLTRSLALAVATCLVAAAAAQQPAPDEWPAQLLEILTIPL